MSDKKSEPDLNNPYDPLSVETEVITIDFLKSDALVGQILDGRFLIVKDLTESGADAGGIGLVYLARDKKMMDREVVVKILQKSALANADFLRKFQHEKEALILLDHPNIVRILDSGELADKNPFMVMEYIPGYSLNKVLSESGKLPFDFIAHVTESVTDALSAAHSKKILHRDIKPANIMLTPQEENFERVRLIDFGIARVENPRLAEATKASFSIGTLPYMAPEQVEGKLEQTPAIDIYAFAIVVYQMLTGKLPFMPQSHVDMFLMQKEGMKILPSELRNDLPAEAEKILLSALEYEAEKRPQNARAFGRHLAKILRENTNYKTNREDHLPTTEKFAPLKLKSEEISTPPPTEPSIVKGEITFPMANLQTQPQKKSNKTLLWALLGLLILTAISIPVGLAIWKSGNETAANKTNINANSATAENAAPRELTYYLNVQKMRDGKPFEEPFKSSGQEVFENGYKFKMNFQSDSAGFIYLFNEDKDAQGKTFYNILYPTPKTNNGSAEVSAKQQIETNQNTFSGSRGTEIVWLIWTSDKSDEMESVKQSAFDAQGKVSDEKNAGKLTVFLQKNKDENVEANKDTANQQTVIRAKGDNLVYRLELEHR